MNSTHFTLPIVDPVLTFAIVMVILLIAPLIATKLRMPGIIGLLVAGAIVGPNAIGIFERGVTFQLLGTVGLLYIMFTAGLEIDLNQFFKYRNHSIVFGFFTFMIPQTIGMGVAMYVLNYDYMVALLLGSVLASHTLLAYPVISRLGLSKSNAVTMAVGGTIITDTAALLVLAIVVGSTEGALNMAFWIRLGGGFGLYCLALFLILPRVGRWFFRKVGSEGVTEYVFVLAAVFLAAFLSEVAGVEPIIGAFLAGLALNRLIPESSTLMNRIDFVGNALFIPFFLISVGMLVDVHVFFANPKTFKVAVAMIGTVILGKWLGAIISQKIFRQTHEEGMVVFGLSLAQAGATLAAALVAFDVGLFDEAVLNATILMIAVTCFLAPIIGERYGRRLVIQQHDARGDVDSETPQRILIPMANAATARTLMDFMLILRERSSQEPVYPLTVVPDDGETTIRVANAEKMLSNAVIHGASAEVPVVPMTRVAHNPASGIARAIVERRISDVVMGWHGPDGLQRGMFGRLIDQLLEESEQQIFVCKLVQPINTTTRVVVVFPPHIELHPGFSTSVRALKRLTNALGALVTGLCLQEDMRRVRLRYETVAPEVTSSFVGFLTFEDLFKTLIKRVEPNDLVVFLAARTGTVAWSTELERLPGQMTKFDKHNIVYLFPQQMESAPMSVKPSQDVNARDLLRPERLALNIPPMGYDEAISYVLSTHFDSDKRRLDAVAAEVISDETGFSTEATHGVILAHTRTSEIFRPMVFVGASKQGLIQADSDMPKVYLIFILLNPDDTPLQTHLQHFAELGQIVGYIEDAQKLAQSQSKGDLIDFLQAISRTHSAHEQDDEEMTKDDITKLDGPADDEMDQD